MKKLILLSLMLASLAVHAAAQQPANGVFINKDPLHELEKAAREKIAADPRILEQPFRIEITGTLGWSADRKTNVLKDIKVIRSNDTNETEALAEKAILAVGESGFFGYLSQLSRVDSPQVTIRAEQSADKLVASMRSEDRNENSARTTASALNMLLSFAAANAHRDDERILLKSTKISTQGKAFIITLDLTTTTVREMILQKLALKSAADTAIFKLL